MRKLYNSEWTNFELNTAEFFTLATAEDVKERLKEGADPNDTNKHGETPLHYAAAWSKKSEIIKILIARGAKLEARTRYGMTPLHFASLLSVNPDVVTGLLALGADPRVKDNKGNTVKYYMECNKNLRYTAIYYYLGV